MSAVETGRAGEIVVESCTKRFGSVTAVNDVTLTIPGGEFLMGSTDPLARPTPAISSRIVSA